MKKQHAQLPIREKNLGVFVQKTPVFLGEKEGETAPDLAVKNCLKKVTILQ